MAAKPRNPWLGIPLADYEAHMALPQVRQAELLADVLATVVREHAPRSVAILGCAGGNGFDRVPVDVRLVGIDVNPDYIAVARARYGDRAGLELYAVDVNTDDLSFESVDVAYAALFFEHVEPVAALRRIAGKLATGGTLVAVLQLPSAVHGDITPSPYTSLEALAPTMRLVEPATLARVAASEGCMLIGEDVATAGGGKRFAVQTYRRS